MSKTKQLEVKAQPLVINWAIQSSGWKISEISSKIAVSEDNINKWVSGEKKPTLRQLRALAKKLKRPLAAFLLPAPPEEKKLPEDFRIPSYKAVPLSKEVLLAIRRAGATADAFSAMHARTLRNTSSHLGWITF